MSLEGKRVAVLAEEGYQELELWYPILRLREEGADVVVVAPQTVKAYESRLGYPLLAELTFEELDIAALDGVVIPGGEAGQRLERLGAAVELVRDSFERGLVTAAIGTGTGVLAAAGALKGRQFTTDESSGGNRAETGGNFVNEEVVVDGSVITSRGADDLPAFFSSIQQTLLSKGK
jgi:protease I